MEKCARKVIAGPQYEIVKQNNSHRACRRRYVIHFPVVLRYCVLLTCCVGCGRQRWGQRTVVADGGGYRGCCSSYSEVLALLCPVQRDVGWQRCSNEWCRRRRTASPSPHTLRRSSFRPPRAAAVTQQPRHSYLQDDLW